MGLRGQRLPFYNLDASIVQSTGEAQRGFWTNPEEDQSTLLGLDSILTEAEKR